MKHYHSFQKERKSNEIKKKLRFEEIKVHKLFDFQEIIRLGDLFGLVDDICHHNVLYFYAV